MSNSPEPKLKSANCRRSRAAGGTATTSDSPLRRLLTSAAALAAAKGDDQVQRWCEGLLQRGEFAEVVIHDPAPDAPE